MEKPASYFQKHFMEKQRELEEPECLWEKKLKDLHCLTVKLIMKYSDHDWRSGTAERAAAEIQGSPEHTAHKARPMTEVVC